MTGSDRLVAMNQHYKKYSLDFFLDAQERLGVSNIELWMSLQHFPLDSVTYGDCRQLLKKLDRRNLRVVAATFPSCDFQYQYGCQPRECRDRCVEYFKNGLNAAEELGAEIVTANSGWGYWNEGYAKGIEATRQILEKVVASAERKGITIVMETLTSEESNLVNAKDKLKKLIDEFHSPALKVMIDTVAMMQAGETMEEWFQLFGSDVRYMHFIDGKDSWDHLAWGDGNYPLQKMLDTMERYGYTGYLSQELITEDYLEDPFSVDSRNFCLLKNIFKQKR